MAMVKLIAGILLTFVASGSIAQEHQHGNGEKLGAVHFATSCNEVAQKKFNRAVALLHSFNSAVPSKDLPRCWGTMRRAESRTGESPSAIGVILSRRE